MNNKIRLLTLKFKNVIANNEVKWFRGAVIEAIHGSDVLFHNHMDDNYRYSYPLIQYKRIRQCAAMVCMGAGVESIGSFFASYDNRMRIGDRNEVMEIDYLRPSVYTVQVWNSEFTYRLHRWLPLNAGNYHAYRLLATDDERRLFLQKILVGNILSFAKGMGIFLDRELSCNIGRVVRQYVIPYKGVALMAFDIVFTANISLPPYMGLGKNASLNCGIVTPVSAPDSLPVTDDAAASPEGDAQP